MLLRKLQWNYGVIVVRCTPHPNYILFCDMSKLCTHITAVVCQCNVLTIAVMAIASVYCSHGQLLEAFYIEVMNQEITVYLSQGTTHRKLYFWADSVHVKLLYWCYSFSAQCHTFSVSFYATLACVIICSILHERKSVMYADIIQIFFFFSFFSLLCRHEDGSIRFWDATDGKRPSEGRGFHF